MRRGGAAVWSLGVFRSAISQKHTKNKIKTREMDKC